MPRFAGHLLIPGSLCVKNVYPNFQSERSAHPDWKEEIIVGTSDYGLKVQVPYQNLISFKEKQFAFGTSRDKPTSDYVIISGRKVWIDSSTFTGTEASKGGGEIILNHPTTSSRRPDKVATTVLSPTTSGVRQQKGT